MKKMLIIATNYEHTEFQLRGCLNDALNIERQISHRLEIESNKLLGREVTKDNVFAALHSMVSSLAASDHLLVWFSGHGTQVPCYSENEPDGAMEAIVMDDYDGTEDTLITDNELRHVLFTAIDGATVTFGSDSCHSGDLLRGVSPGYAKTQKNGKRIRFVEYRGNPVQKLYSEPADVGILFAGCQSHQTSADALIDGTYQGAFTHYLLKALENHGFAISNMLLASETAERLKAAGYEQEPALDCAGKYVNAKFLA